MVLDHSGPQRNCGGPSRQLQPENFRGTSGYDAEDFRKLQTETGAAKRSPTETQKLGSRLGTDFSGGVTASTGTVAARRHAGVHAPLIV